MPVQDLDGDQELDCYWIDPIAAAKLMVARDRFAGKICYQYEREESANGCRVFVKANSGLVFQSAQQIDPYSVPLLLLFNADKCFPGKHKTHHPVYGQNS